MKPTKAKTPQQTRPHTSLDFTRSNNNNLELFSNDFSDPFNTPKQNNTSGKIFYYKNRVLLLKVKLIQILFIKYLLK